MEAAAGMLIHSTALRPIDMAQCPSPLCVVFVGVVRPLSGRHWQGVSVRALACARLKAAEINIHTALCTSMHLRNIYVSTHLKCLVSLQR